MSISEKYGNDNVLVTVEWDQVPNVAYSTDSETSPLVHIMHTGRTSYQVTVPYNTKYNFSVVAATPCRPNATAFIILKYGEAEIIVAF